MLYYTIIIIIIKNVIFFRMSSLTMVTDLTFILGSAVYCVTLGEFLNFSVKLRFVGKHY